jgi:hypothetical protein
MGLFTFGINVTLDGRDPRRLLLGNANSRPSWTG